MKQREKLLLLFTILLTFAFTANTYAAPPAPASISVPTYHCSGSSVTYTVAAVPSATYYAWTVEGTGWTPSSATTTNPVNYLPLTAGTGSATISVTANDDDGASAPVTAYMTPMTVPAAPTAITSPGTHCFGSTRTYSISPISGADYYEWYVSGDGWSGSSTITTIDLVNSSGTVTCNLAVAAFNECGSSTTYSVNVVPQLAVPAAPAAPVMVDEHATSHCTNVTRTYQVTQANGVDEYMWVVEGAGWSLENHSQTMTTDNDIDIVAGAASGTISIYALNDCGISTATVATFAPVLVPVPQAPASITPPLLQCNGDIRQYIIPEVSGAQWYNWEVTGNGWSISGNSGTFCMITAGTGSATISCSAENDCGSSTFTSITFTPNIYPAQATQIYEPTTHCAGTSATYSIDPIPGANEYYWTVTGTGWLSTSSTTTEIVVTAGNGTGSVSVSGVNVCGHGPGRQVIVNPLHIPSNNITMHVPSIHCSGASRTYSIDPQSGATSYEWDVIGASWAFTPTSSTFIEVVAGSASGTISVRAINACGSSAFVSRVVDPDHVPQQPDHLYTPAVHCENATEIYAIAPVDDAISYQWAIDGSGWEIMSTDSTTNEIAVRAGTGTCDISVVAIGHCGTGSPLEQEISASPLPEYPNAIEQPSNHCVGVEKAYSIQRVDNADSYEWTITNEANTTTPWTGNSSTDYFIRLTAGTGSATLTVRGINNCGAGQARTVVITSDNVPTQPQNITVPSEHCPGSIKTYSIPAVSGATSYVWTFTGSGWSGANASNSCQVTAGDGAGTISVVAVNNCGQSAARTINVNATPYLDSPDAINPPSTHCEGEWEVYRVTQVQNAVGYQWTITGNGWSGSSSADTILVKSGADPAVITCAAINNCGAGAPITYNANSTPIPSSAFNISKDTIAVTKEALVIQYAGSAASDATYQWDFDGGTANPQSGQGPFSVTWDQVGRKQISLTVTEDGCPSTVTLLNVVVVDTIGVEDMGDFSVSITPNPNEGQFEVTISQLDYPEIRVQVYDMLGNIYLDKTARIMNGIYTDAINLCNASTGVYYLKMSCGPREVVKQIRIIR